MELRQLLILRTGSLNGSTMLKADLLNILDLKSFLLSAKQLSWCPSEYSVQMIAVLYSCIETLCYMHIYLNQRSFICSCEVVGIFDD